MTQVHIFIKTSPNNPPKLHDADVILKDSTTDTNVPSNPKPNNDIGNEKDAEAPTATDNNIEKHKTGKDTNPPPSEPTVTLSEDDFLALAAFAQKNVKKHKSGNDDSNKISNDTSKQVPPDQESNNDNVLNDPTDTEDKDTNNSSEKTAPVIPENKNSADQDTNGKYFLPSNCFTINYFTFYIIKLVSSSHCSLFTPTKTTTIRQRQPSLMFPKKKITKKKLPTKILPIKI